MVLAALVVPTFAVKLVIEFGVRVTGALPEPFRGIVSVCELPSTVTTRFNVAVLVPDPVGVKFTEIPQFAGAAGSEVGGEIGHVLPGSPKSPALGPEIETDVIGSGTSCSLVTVTVLGGALVVPSNCAVKVSEVGATTTGFTPVPFSVTFNVFTEVTIVSVPAGWAPVTVGVMVTPMVHDEPVWPEGARVVTEVPHVVDGSRAYGVPAVTPTVVIDTVLASLFLSVKVSTGLVSLIATLPKLKDVGEMEGTAKAAAMDEVSRQNIAVSESVTSF